MLVPSFLFGGAREVRANVAKALTRLKRGETLEEICESSSKVDVLEHPQSLIWIERPYVLRAASEQDFRAVLLTNGMFDSTRIPFAHGNTIREQSVDYLSRSPWGSVVLNSGHCGTWFNELPMRPLRPSRRGHVATLRGTLEHWGALMSLGSRYYSGGLEALTFPETLPAYGGLLAEYGLNPRSGGSVPAWKDLPSLCDESFVARINSDDQFWDELVRKWRSEAGTPDLAPENLSEITTLCRAGSWDKHQWDFLRAHGGEALVEQALAAIEATRDWGKLIGVFVHALGDMDRAARLFSDHEATSPDVHWAIGPIARHLASKDPERSATLLFQSVEARVVRGGNSNYRRSVSTLKEARSVLLNAHLESVWKKLLDIFRAAHSRRKFLIALLAQEFPSDVWSGAMRERR
jgi:hypothetical protein